VLKQVISGKDTVPNATPPQNTGVFEHSKQFRKLEADGRQTWARV
jgi:hypothetical protein